MTLCVLQEIYNVENKPFVDVKASEEDENSIILRLSADGLVAVTNDIIDIIEVSSI